MSTVCKTKRDGTLTISDGSATPKTLEIAFTAGDLSIDIPGPTVVNVLDRGQLGSAPCVRYGDDQPMTFSFTAQFHEIGNAASATLADIIAQSGYVASDWTTVLNGGDGEVFAVDLLWTIEGTDHGESSDYSISLENCVLSGSISEGETDTLNISGTAYDLYPTVS